MTELANAVSQSPLGERAAHWLKGAIIRSTFCGFAGCMAGHNSKERAGGGARTPPVEQEIDGRYGNVTDPASQELHMPEQIGEVNPECAP